MNSFFHRQLSGFVSDAHFTRKLVSQNVKLSEPVEKVLFKQYQKVHDNTPLGLVGRILEIEDFVAVVDDKQQCRSVVSKLDFLTFVAHQPTKNGQNGQNGHRNGN